MKVIEYIVDEINIERGLLFLRMMFRVQGSFVSV